ncbi:MAG TPA: alanine--tRNA ligase-related protein [Chthoniobacteraceae bacterium]|jgi:alanyl-tRNA synthetase|nr:alanine--tRNA ligase-related protein [Chthoniobacteraceae bacterium]
MTSAQIRQSFLDFFREKKHTIVPSSSLLPDSPNLLFTNAGMNQFVPIFLGQKAPDVSKWAGAAPGLDTRAADTQKCIRAGGKHNDLEDVGLDTYHHTFFEMLGNWSFGDYFKKEAIEWAWELVVGRWQFPAQRLYATVYSPGPGDPSEFDQEAWNHWAALFIGAGLDPKVHIVNGNKKDNFWMMGDTGPCGPCSELHVDLTPAGDTKGGLVNKGSPECIEIWNLVFIQFNANPDGTFSPLPARHVDTGMGFERVTSILQCTGGFTDFTGTISNYETDIFRPIFDEIERLSGKKYSSTLPAAGSGAAPGQETIDVAFRVIADHIRTLSFAIADGIQPGNNDRHYVLRRILRRAVRYGRSLGLTEPFFFRLVDVLARTMGDVFPELRAKQKQVEEVLRREEEAFNKTLDKGIALFEAEAANLLGSAGFQPAPSGILPDGRSASSRYWKRRLPHYERPHGIYHVTFSTSGRKALSPPARSIVRDAIVHFDQKRYDLFAACVMPDHVHILFQPWVKETDAKGALVFWNLEELMHSLKSFTAKEINKIQNLDGGQVWEHEYHDRLMRSDTDVEEKYFYICENPQREKLVATDNERYSWLWIWTDRNGTEAVQQDAGQSEQDARAPRGTISGKFAFRLYDEQGFPLDLTELMARERGLTVDVAEFEALMEEQRERARKAQKKEIITISEGTQEIDATEFLGYDFLETEAGVKLVTPGKNADELNIILDRTVLYGEMGGQVGDTGVLHVPGPDRSELGRLEILDTQKKGGLFIHRAKVAVGRAPEPGEAVRVSVQAVRRNAIQRHHTVTHLLHWALHEVTSPDATQKGSFVGPEKMTFDFNSPALTPKQVRDIERLVNEKIIENAPVNWTEVPFAQVKGRPDIMQFFGDKYGDVVRVVQIGGAAGSLNGYSMELCAGTHTRGTGEIGLFRIVSEGAVAAGVRRFEALAGLAAFDAATADAERLKAFAGKLNAPLGEIEKKLDALLAQQKQLEKQLKAAQQAQAGNLAKELIAKARTISGTPAIIEDMGAVSGDQLQDIADALKGQFNGVIVLAGASEGQVALLAAVSADFTGKFQAGKIIQQIAPAIGGKGGGRPDNARGAGRDAEKLPAALDAAAKMLGA